MGGVLIIVDYCFLAEINFHEIYVYFQLPDELFQKDNATCDAYVRDFPPGVYGSW